MKGSRHLRYPQMKIDENLVDVGAAATISRITVYPGRNDRPAITLARHGALAKAEREGVLREKIRFFCRFGLLIVDKIGYLPVIPGGGSLFFQFVNARYEKGARDIDLKSRIFGI